MESVAILRAADAVPVRPAAALSDGRSRASAAGARSRSTPTALITALATCLGPVALFFFVAALHGQPPMGARGRAGIHGLLAGVRPVSAGREGPRHRAASLAHPGARQVRRGSAQLRTRAAARSRCWRSGARGKRRGYPLDPGRRHSAGRDSVDQLAVRVCAGDRLRRCCCSRRGASPSFASGAPFAAAGLAWLLACFWLTPSFISTVAFNWPADSFGYQLWRARNAGSLLALAAALVADPLRLRDVAAPRSISASSCSAPSPSAGSRPRYYVYGDRHDPRIAPLRAGVRIVPDPRGGTEAVRLALAKQGPDGAPLRVRLGGSDAAGRTAAAVGLPDAAARALDTRAASPRSNTALPNGSTTIARRAASSLPEACGSGSTPGSSFRKWAAVSRPACEIACHSISPFTSAPAGPCVPAASRRTCSWNCRRSACDIVVVHGPKSQEYYRDYAHPEWVAAVLPAVFARRRRCDLCPHSAPARTRDASWKTCRAMKRALTPSAWSGMSPRFRAACGRAGSTPLTSSSTAPSATAQSWPYR